MAKRHSSVRYLLCLDNDSYPASLEVRKVYRAVADPVAAGHGMVRVIDESGEDYLYPKNLFVAVKVPITAKKVFA
jgi:hypothetical protein